MYMTMGFYWKRMALAFYQGLCDRDFGGVGARAYFQGEVYIDLQRGFLL